MKFFKLELTSYEDRYQIWFIGEDKLSEEDFGRAVSEAMLEVFNKLEDTVPDSAEVRKDYPLFVLALDEETFEKVMEEKGFKKLKADVVVKGDSYTVLWETPQGKKKITPLKDRGNLEDFLISMGVEPSDEDPNKLIFSEF